MTSITNCCVIDSVKIDGNSTIPAVPVLRPDAKGGNSVTSSRSQEKKINVKVLSIHFRELVECLERLPAGLLAGAGAQDPLMTLARDIGDDRLLDKVRDSPMFSVPAGSEIEQLMADPTDGVAVETMKTAVAEAIAVPGDPALAVAEAVAIQADPAPAESSITSLPSVPSTPAIAVANSSATPNILQFSTSVYFCKEGEEDCCAVIHIMRLGDALNRCSCNYETVDDSGVSGERYEGRSGTVTFEPGESIKEVVIPIISDDHWCAVLEFMMKLTKPQGAILGKYLWTCRIKVMDDDAFPTNKFRPYFQGDRTDIEKIPKVKLLLEYFKYNFEHPVVRRGTIKYVTLGQVHNLYWILQLFLTQILVDSILPSADADSYDGCQTDDRLLGIFECPITTGQKEATLVTWAILLIAPFAAVHLFDFRVRFWKIGGSSRITLQLNLLRKFFNYSEEVRHNLHPSEVMLAITRTSDELVADGYLQLLPFSRDLAKILLVVAVQIYIDQMDALVPVVVFPIILFCFLCVRSNKTQRSLKAELDEKVGVLAHVNYCGERLRILTDYVMRWHATDEFEAKLKRYNRLLAMSGAVHVNNMYAAPWVGMIFVGAWFIVGGRNVIHKRLPLGLFLMNMGIIKEVGSCWAKIYQIGMSMQRAFVPLQEICYLMNLPTDLEDRMHLNRKRREKGEELRKKSRASLQSSARDSTSPSAYAADLVPIQMTDVSFSYSLGKRATFAGAIDSMTFEFPQGSFVAIVGEAGHGKSTLLKVLGGVLLPASGDLLVPPHLRVLHISQRPMFIRGTIYENLTFSIKEGDTDGAPERALAICKQLMLPERICAHLDARDPVFNQKAEWDVVLSLSECTLLNIARALMCNPEILILHKPTIMLNDRLADNTIACLRKFVDQKGLEQDPAHREVRRPRTCVMTAARIAGVRIADKVVEVQKSGVILRDKEYLEGHNSLLA